jgi:hypothetical protein
MEYDQILIIRFLWDKKIDTHEIAHRLQEQFGEHAYALRTFRFCITEVWLDRQDFHDDSHIRRHPLDDLDAKILSILDKSPFESVRSITETLFVAYSRVLLHIHDSISFRSFHLH